jgi:hemerythrin
MPEIDPAQLPDLPVAFMNADHARELRLVNDVEAALGSHVRGEETLEHVVERLSLLAVHTREHFLREEAMMREARFPAYPVHRAEHDRFLAEMDAEVRALRERGEGARLARYLSEKLPAWFVNHVRTLDLVTARFVAGHGLRQEG